MFELEIENGPDSKGFAVERLNMLRKVIESLADFVEKMEIRACNKGLTIQVMDSMHVAFVDIFMSGDMFTKFRCDREIHLGIQIKTFLAILRNITLDDSSVLRLSCEDVPQRLLIEYIADNSKYEADMVLYEIENENYSVPHIDYDSVVQMPTDQFRTVSKNVGAFGEYISLESDKEQFSFRQTGDFIKNVMTLKSDGTAVTVDCTEPVKVEVGMKYINLLNKISSLSNKITLNLGASAPVFFEIKLYETLGQIRMYVAPKSDN